MKRSVAIIAVLLAVVYCLNNNNWSHPKNYEINEFSIIQQPDEITCGPTSVTMLLKRYGKDATIDEVKSKTKTQWFKYEGKPVGMSSPDFISSSVNYFGVPARLIRGNIDLLKHSVSKNKPVIVLLRSGKVYWHYVVVIGYDENHIIIADPAGVKKVLTTEQFSGAWEFSSDMKGNSVTTSCSICDGEGYWTDVGLGPFRICPICDGSGEMPDVLVSLLKSAEIYPKTMIVPSINIDNNGG